MEAENTFSILASDAPSTQLNLNPFTACLNNEFRFLKIVDLQSACFACFGAETLQGPIRPLAYASVLDSYSS